MQPWTRRSAVAALVAVGLFASSIAMLRNSVGGQAGGIALLAAPLAALAGVALGAKALQKREPRTPALAATAVNALLAAGFVLFLVLLLEAIRNFT